MTYHSYHFNVFSCFLFPNINVMKFSKKKFPLWRRDLNCVWKTKKLFFNCKSLLRIFSDILCICHTFSLSFTRFVSDELSEKIFLTCAYLIKFSFLSVAWDKINMDYEFRIFISFPVCVYEYARRQMTMTTMII
jgi:hypothetical protein